MKDTLPGNFPDTFCNDCGEKDCSFEHWGSLILEGDLIGTFCHFCLEQRQEQAKKKKKPLPLGVQPPGIPLEFTKRALDVKTSDEMVYYLGLTRKENERIVVVQNKGKFSHIRVRVMRLEIGQRAVFRMRKSKDRGLFYTAPVVSIEPK